MKRAINHAPRNGYVAELHLQCLKYAKALEGVSGREFCEGLDLKPAWGTEFSKMRKIADRLEEAGLKVDLI
ncbi:MAG: transcription factor [Sphingomonas sp.]